jgi:arsenate reductase
MAKTVLFACTHNAGRSQMAAAFFNQIASPEKAVARSAGTQPADRVDPAVITAMREVGIDLEGVRPQLLTPTMAQGATLLVTMGCGEQCPVVPGVQIVDWALPDPKDQPLEEVRRIRDDIRIRVELLLGERGWW